MSEVLPVTTLITLVKKKMAMSVMSWMGVNRHPFFSHRSLDDTACLPTGMAESLKREML